MAAGNAESATNGVGGIEVKARTFCDSGLIWNSRFLVFQSLTPVTLPIAVFPAGISCFRLLYVGFVDTF